MINSHKEILYYDIKVPSSTAKKSPWLERKNENREKKSVFWRHLSSDFWIPWNSSVYVWMFKTSSHIKHKHLIKAFSLSQCRIWLYWKVNVKYPFTLHCSSFIRERTYTCSYITWAIFFISQFVPRLIANRKILSIWLSHPWPP